MTDGNFGGHAGTALLEVDGDFGGGAVGLINCISAWPLSGEMDVDMLQSRRRQPRPKSTQENKMEPREH